MTVSQWADARRVLSAESSAEPGRWRTDRAPYLRDIMDAIHEPGVRELVVIKSAQVGYTEAINNIIGFHIDQEPAPIMLMQPTLEMGEAWSKDRFAPMVRDCEALRNKVADPRSRDSGSTILHKTFAGGHLTIVGANSPASLASRPIRVLLCDEVDRYPVSAGAEGDPISLAKKRTTTYRNRVVVLGGTPTVKGESRIEAAYLASDQRYIFVPCPHCMERQRLEWPQVRWTKNEAGEHQPGTAVYVCKHCGAEIDESHKAWMLERREVRAARPFNGIVGLHVSTLYSPWVSWAQMARSFLEARNDPQTLRTWINTELGETWEDQGEAVDAVGLLKRRAPYTPESLPVGVAAITLGVDTQDNRLELQFIGWGAGEQSWIIEHGALRGNPGSAEIWAALDEQRKRKFITEDGRTILVAATGIDSGGHYTQQVYSYCFKHRFERVFALKGAGGTGRLIWPRKPGKTKLSRADVYLVGVDTAKDLIHGRVTKITAPGRGFVNLSASLDQEWCDQFTSERRVSKVTNGRRVSVWRPKSPGIRQEALDCYIYAYAVMLGRRLDLDRIAGAIDRTYRGARATDAGSTPAAPRQLDDETFPPPPVHVRPVRAPVRPRAGGGWLKRNTGSSWFRR